jgi:hypothetical protein
VLAMTVGLIRSETAGDLRTTAGALGLLGALLGTAVAYLAAIAWFRSSLSTTVSHVPVTDLAVILVGVNLSGGAVRQRRQATSSVTSTLPRVALEYGQT